MAITELFILPVDIIITPVAQLEPQLRARFACDDSDFAISRPRSRATAKIINAETAALLRAFEQPQTIVEALIGFSRSRQIDPEQMLIDAFPMIERLIQSGVLVSPEAETARRIRPSFAPGDTLGGCEVLGCVQVLEDSELYQARHNSETVALKIARPGAGDLIKQMIAHEAEILAVLDGEGAPRLLGRGEQTGRPYVVMSWCQGIPISDAAEDLRRMDGQSARDHLADLCLALLDAYAALHGHGVIHADVHPRNVLVDGSGRITLIDFGLANADVTALSEPPRAGVGFYFEPEFARAAQKQNGAARATAAGEQFALAALVYQLLTGSTYVEFSVERDVMLRQIVEEPPLPFVQRGVAAWPGVEATLGRALGKWPKDRFPSVEAFAHAFRVAVGESISKTTAVGFQLQAETPIAPDFLEEVLRLVSPGGAWYESGLTLAPTASLNFGAAGIACALLRLAFARGDPALLALADIWIGRAERAAMRPGAFANAEAGLDSATIGPVSTFHTVSGIACVRAQIAGAMGDVITQQTAISSFLVAASVQCELLDLTLGRSGTLLAAAILLDTCLPVQDGIGNEIRAFGDGEINEIWARLDQQEPVTANSAIDNLGIAHGWGGMIYAGLRWCQAASTDIPPRIIQRLGEVAALGEPFGRGIRWPWLRRQRGQTGTYMAGWCNGNAGYVHLWTLAHELIRDASYLDLAEQAAWGAWEQPSAVGNLCCGLAGQAYALLNLYQHTGESNWLQRARELAAQSATQMRSLLKEQNTVTLLDFRPESLYKGAIGVAALLGDLEHPAQVCQPFFGRER